MAEIRVEPKRRSWTGVIGLILVVLVLLGVAAWFLLYRNG